MDKKQSLKTDKIDYDQYGEKEVFQSEISASQSGDGDYSQLAYFSKLQAEKEKEEEQ